MTPDAGRPDRRELPGLFALPPLPPALDAWFALADTPDGVALEWRGEPLDGLRVVDRDSAIRALEGYRFVHEDGGWVDVVERGEWDAVWIVLDSVAADPIIADLSADPVRILTDAHGRGRWDPEEAYADVAGLLADVVPVPVATGPWAPLPRFTVVVMGLGERALETLLHLRRLPGFPSLPPAGLLALRDRLPLVLGEGMLEQPAAHLARRAREAGAEVEVRAG
jgi:hypothetical protein